MFSNSRMTGREQQIVFKKKWATQAPGWLLISIQIDGKCAEEVWLRSEMTAVPERVHIFAQGSDGSMFALLFKVSETNATVKATMLERADRHPVESAALVVQIWVHLVGLQAVCLSRTIFIYVEHSMLLFALRTA